MGANKEREVYKTAVTLPLAGGTTARWERDGHHIRCSLCGMLMCDKDREGDPIPSNFCPGCGADMRENDDAELDEILKKTAELTMAEKIEFLGYINDVVKENVIRIEDATQIIAVCEEAYKKRAIEVRLT